MSARERKTKMTAIEAANYIFDNRSEFEAKYADVIKRFEEEGIDHVTAEAITITLASYAKAFTDYAKEN